jgi:hypothetical protein
MTHLRRHMAQLFGQRATADDVILTLPRIEQPSA